MVATDTGARRGASDKRPSRHGRRWRAVAVACCLAWLTAAVGAATGTDPQLALSAPRVELRAGDTALIRPHIAPLQPGTRYWLRIDGLAEPLAVEPGRPVQHRFSHAGTYHLVLVAEHQGARLESDTLVLRVAGAAPGSAAAWPWLVVGTALLLGSTLGWRRGRPVRRRLPLSAACRVSVRPRPDRLQCRLTPARGAAGVPGVGVVLDRGLQLLVIEQPRLPNHGGPPDHA